MSYDDPELDELMEAAARDGGATPDAVNAVNSLQQRLETAGRLRPPAGQLGSYWVEDCRCSIGPNGLALNGCPAHTGRPTPPHVQALVLAHTMRDSLPAEVGPLLAWLAGEVEGLQRQLDAAYAYNRRRRP